MPMWPRGAAEFEVSVTDNRAARARYSCIPKPVLEHLGGPARLRFRISRGRVAVEAAEKKGRKRPAARRSGPVPSPR